MTRTPRHGPANATYAIAPASRPPTVDELLYEMARDLDDVRETIIQTLRDAIEDAFVVDAVSEVRT